MDRKPVAFLTFKFSVIWGACGKCGVGLGDYPTQKDVDAFLKKHMNCQDNSHYPRLVGYIKQPETIKGKRVAAMLVPEPPTCKNKECMSYRPDSDKFCSQSCEDAVAKERLARIAAKKNSKDGSAYKKLADELMKIPCKRRKCKNYKEAAKGFCSKRCKRRYIKFKSRKERE